MVSKVTEVSGSTTVTETRTVNNLNQITQNVVVGASTVTWTYEYDLNGCMTSKSDGVNTTTYSWDEDNRLTLVTLPDSSTVAYNYDVKGRMITRTDTSGTTSFVWSGMKCVQETDYLGNVTRYYMLGGFLRSFDRTVSAVTSVYQIHSDALGSVRKVTDSSGTVQATYDYDAWGNQLASTSDSIPNGGLQYRFIGGLGVRWDEATGLYYVRQRWYDPVLGRFVSRDAKRGANRYQWSLNNPITFVDFNGLDPIGTAIGLLQQAVGLGWNGLSTATSNQVTQELQSLYPLAIIIDDSQLPANTDAKTTWGTAITNPLFTYSSDPKIFLSTQYASNPCTAAQWVRLLSNLVHEGTNAVLGPVNDYSAEAAELVFEANMITYLASHFSLKNPSKYPDFVPGINNYSLLIAFENYYHPDDLAAYKGT